MMFLTSTFSTYSLHFSLSWSYSYFDMQNIQNDQLVKCNMVLQKLRIIIFSSLNGHQLHQLQH